MSLGKDVSNFLSMVIQLKNMDLSDDSTLLELEKSMEKYYLKKLKVVLEEDSSDSNENTCDPVVHQSQEVPVVDQSQEVPVVQESQDAPVVEQSEEVPVVDQSQDLPVLDE